MKQTLAAFLTLSGVAHAHPGHSSFDWFSAPPHAAHAGDYASALFTLAIVAAFWGACVLLSKKP